VIKLFVVGVFLGAAAAGAALFYLPLVDQERELSLIEVRPNGGNSEVFHANIPGDRIMIGAPDQAVAVPAGLDWPDDELFANARAELFKIRNSRDVVVGVASRIAANDENGDLVEWTLHLPARGSAYVLMLPAITDSGDRSGDLRSGTREFGGLEGSVTERWVAGSVTAEEESAGRLELHTSLVAVVEVQL
jgi:hypothetical protein